MAIHASSPSILFATVLLAFLSASTADENNLLLTGEVLTTDSQLSNDAAVFVMQDDCNLVLYRYTTGNGFVSDTHGQGQNCTLTLSNLGQLIIYRADGTTVWTSTVAPNSTHGRYAAVLQPDGQVAVYGRTIWSTRIQATSGTPFSSSNADSNNNGAKVIAPAAEARNVLFTDQILYNDSKLVTRDHTLIMREDCNLVLKRASHPDAWYSGTAGKGQNCYARLTNQGQLVIADMRGFNTLWSNSPFLRQEGRYVLVLQITGEAAIYGPIVWSTANF